MSERKIVPIHPAPAADGDCSAAEPFALMVLGDSMEPEFTDGEVIVVEPEGLATDGSYVIAQVDGEWIFRQLTRTAECWRLTALNPAYAPVDLADLTPIRGVVIQKSKPGRRRALRRYVD